MAEGGEMTEGGGMTDQAEADDLQQFRSWHDEAYLYINQAVTQESPDINRQDVALIMYQRGLGVLDQALCIDTNRKGDGWARARTMQQKMSRTRTHIESRIRTITDELAPPLNTAVPARPPRPASGPTRPPSGSSRPANGPSRSAAGPPSYQEATAGSLSWQEPPPSYSLTNPHLNVEAELEEICGEAASNGAPRSGPRGLVPTGGSQRLPNSGSSGSLSETGEILFSIPQVQIFHISPSGEVTTPSYPETLHVVKFQGGGTTATGAPAFIEVGSWTYPLLKGRSPVLKSDYGGYMFPDLESGIEGSAVGMLIPESVTSTDREILESLFTELTTSFKTKEDITAEYAEYAEFSSSLANGLVKGAELVGKGMVKGAVKTSELLFHGTDFAKQYIQQEEQPRTVDPRVRQGLEAARVVSTGACKVSGWMVSKVGSATMALGRLLAPHLERGATHALTHISGKSSHESSSQLKIVGEVASGTVAAVSTMYMALENSSKILAKNLANNTVMIVSHKYGSDVAAVTDAAFSTAGNSYLAFYNTAALGPKGIAKRVAKDAGKAVIGVDQATVNERASRAPDSAVGVADVLETLQPRQNTQSQSGSGEMGKLPPK